MLRGIYTAASGLLVGQKRLDVVANNLANVNTTGFKRDTTVSQSFPELFLQRVGDRAGNARPEAPQAVGPLGLGTFIASTATRLTNGSLQNTGNPLDVAIMGDGLFTVRTPQGIRYTRQGSFTQNTEGTLVTQEGYEVLVGGRSVSGAQGELSIDATGQVRAGGRNLGRLNVVTSRDLGALRKEGSGLWAQAGAGESSTLITPADASGQYELRAGYLEASNVDPTAEMVEMMVIMRHFEANQRAIQIQDETLQKAASEIGRVG